MRTRYVRALVIAPFIALLGCETGDSVKDGGTTVIVKPPQDNSVVCDPLGGGGSAQAQSGLISNLYYLDDTQPRYTTVGNYIAQGHLAPVSLFFDRLAVPTRPFDRGFVTEAGEQILNANGNNLYEYFALHMESNLKLGPDDPEGQYQMAVLSDDGTNLFVNDAADYRLYVNNDGTHPTRMGCSIDALTFNSTTRIPMKLDYYQGPRFHIALTVLWRVKPADGSLDPLCGSSGNSRFWDSTQNPPAPQQSYYDLIGRGWKVLTTDNFELPGQQNPCSTSDMLAISAPTLRDSGRDFATFGWTTNIPADSMVELTVVSTGAKFSTPVDSAMVTNHLVTVTGLSPNTLYSFQMVSSTGPIQTVKSDPDTFRTAR